LGPKREERIREIFPFTEAPSDALVNGTFLITDPELRFARGVHQTSSAVLVYPRFDRVLLPAAALGNEQPLLNMRVLRGRALKRHVSSDNEQAVWVGRQPLFYRSLHTADPYTPERAAEFLEAAHTVKDLYTGGLRQGLINRQRLRTILHDVFHLRFAFLKSYDTDLPDELERHEPAALAELDGLFVGIEEKVKALQDVYDALTPRQRLLLTEGFRIAFEVNMTSSPFYIETEHANIMASPRTYAKELRDPREIGAELRGVPATNIAAVHVPHEIIHRPVGRIAIEQLLAMNIPLERIHLDHTEFLYRSQHIGHCALRYGNFTAMDYVEAVKERRMVPALSEP
jgi:hypothetical protein